MLRLKNISNTLRLPSPRLDLPAMILLYADRSSQWLNAILVIRAQSIANKGIAMSLVLVIWQQTPLIFQDPVKTL
jgi:hypothetical protein